MTVVIILAGLRPAVAMVGAWRVECSIDARRDIEVGAAVRRCWRLPLAAALWIAVVSAVAGEPAPGVTMGVLHLLSAIAWSLRFGNGMVRIPFDSPVHHSMSGPVDTRALHVDLAELTGRGKDRRTGARHLAVPAARPPGLTRSIIAWLRGMRTVRRQGTGGGDR